MPCKCVASALVLPLCLAVTGCGGGKSFSDDDFKKVKTGMSEKEVNDILGAPVGAKEVESPLGKMKTATWKSNGKDYAVAYTDGKVMMAVQGNIDETGGVKKK